MFKSMKLLRFVGLMAIALVVTLAVPQILRSESRPTVVQVVQTGQPTPTGQALPEAAQKCLESRGKRYEVVATATEGNKSFYYTHLWLYGTDSDFESWYSLISVEAGQCQLLKGIKSGLKPISSFMATPTAQQMELKRYGRDIDRAGGKQAFAQRLNAQLNPPKNHRSAYTGVTIYLSEEQVWALRQLGIQFSDNYHLLKRGETVNSN